MDTRIEKAVRRAATQAKIEPAALLAVIEVECPHAPFEYDNITPRFLFERHVFYKNLPKNRREEVVKLGLASPVWDRKKQYKDLGTSKGRIAVLGRALSIDEEAAYRSCSWGIGQVMGFNAEKLGYASATHMFNTLRTGGIAAQVDCMLRFIREKNLIPILNRHDWAGFALAYNGPAYAQNDYDTRLEAAYDRWKLKDAGVEPEETTEVALGRTPVQNAEPSKSAWTTPEGVSAGVGAGTGLAAALKGDKGGGPLDYALAIVIVASAIVGGYFLIKRMRRMPE